MVIEGGAEQGVRTIQVAQWKDQSRSSTLTPLCDDGDPVL